MVCRKESVMKHNRKFAAVLALVVAFTMAFSSVSVNAAVKKLTIKASSTTVTVGKTVKIKASTKVTWKTSDKKIATVSSKGMVKGKSEGTVKITATSKANKKLKKTIRIKVVAKTEPAPDPDPAPNPDPDPTPVPTPTTDGLVVNQAAKTVSLECTSVKWDMYTVAVMHNLVVNENGTMAKRAPLHTKVTTDDFYKAIESIAGNKMWNNKAGTAIGDTESIDDQLAQNIGNADYAKFEVTVTVDGKIYPLNDIITYPGYDRKDYTGNYEVIFAGNVDNQHASKTGCITCFGSCDQGVTSCHDTAKKIHYMPKKAILVPGKTVTVTYKLK